MEQAPVYTPLPPSSRRAGTMADKRAAGRRLKPPQNGSASKPCHEKRPHPPAVLASTRMGEGSATFCF